MGHIIVLSLILFQLLPRPPVVEGVLTEGLRTCRLKMKPGDLTAFDPERKTYYSVPRPTNAFDQHLQSYNIALCNRLERGEITKDEFDALLDSMIERVRMVKRIVAEKLRQRAIEEQRERQRLAIERERLAAERNRLATERNRQAIERQRMILEWQRLTEQRQAEEARRRAEIIQQTWREQWTAWAQQFQARMQNPIRCEGRLRADSGRIDVDCF